MLTADRFRVIHIPFVGEERPWLVVDIAKGEVSARFVEWAHADQTARNENRAILKRWKDAAKRSQAFQRELRAIARTALATEGGWS